MIRCASSALYLCGVLSAQTFTQRGFLDTQLWLYPQTSPNDSGNAVDGMLLRYEPSWKPNTWLKLNASFDARVDTHDEVDRSLRIDWRDRTLERPALSIRRLSAIVTKGRFTAEVGKQFIRWGKADILNPTDRFAPKDFLNVVDTEILAVTALRLTYDTGADSFDVVWQPLFTPSRTPLLNQRWTVIPAAIQIEDLGANYPGRSAFGARWNHTGAGYELSLSYYDGFNNLPLFAAQPIPPGVAIKRFYPPLRFYGADAAVPLNGSRSKPRKATTLRPTSRKTNTSSTSSNSNGKCTSGRS